MERSVLFPDFMYQGNLEIPKEHNFNIKKDIDNIKSGYSFKTEFGWITDKTKGLNAEFIKKLTLIMGNMFTKEINKTYNISGKRVEIIEPYLVGINPGSSYQINIERSRWYNGAVWLQTGKNGSNLILENFNSKKFVGPPDINDFNYRLQSKKNSVIFWPSHIPWGFSANESSIETILLITTFILPNIMRKTNG